MCFLCEVIDRSTEKSEPEAAGPSRAAAPSGTPTLSIHFIFRSMAKLFIQIRVDVWRGSRKRPLGESRAKRELVSMPDAETQRLRGSSIAIERPSDSGVEEQREGEGSGQGKRCPNEDVDLILHHGQSQGGEEARRPFIVRCD